MLTISIQKQNKGLFESIKHNEKSECKYLNRILKCFTKVLKNKEYKGLAELKPISARLSWITREL